MKVQRKRHPLWSSFDTMACMDAIKSLLLYYSPKIPLLGSLLNYGTKPMLNNGTLLLLVAWYLTSVDSHLLVGF